SKPLFSKLRSHVNAPFCSIPIDLEGPVAQILPALGIFCGNLGQTTALRRRLLRGMTIPHRSRHLLFSR
ncbi:hypothetical protein, partial [Mesorhizobium sp. M2A.F.Ca.ET.015.02.1.1]